jgi:hypothetical protein
MKKETPIQINMKKEVRIKISLTKVTQDREEILIRKETIRNKKETIQMTSIVTIDKF